MGSPERGLMQWRPVDGPQHRPDIGPDLVTLNNAPDGAER